MLHEKRRKIIRTAEKTETEKVSTIRYHIQVEDGMLSNVIISLQTIQTGGKQEAGILQEDLRIIFRWFSQTGKSSLFWKSTHYSAMHFGESINECSPETEQLLKVCDTEIRVQNTDYY